MCPSVHPAPATPPPVVRRGPLRRLLEVRGLVGGHAAAHVGARLRAGDGTPLAGVYLPGPGGEAAVLLLHGFGAHARKPAYAALADALAARLPVLALDLRGHGDSGGASTFGDREVEDVAAGRRWLAGLGHRRVVAVGVSMGATAALHAAAASVPLAGVVAVSGPARFRDPPETDPTRRLHRIWHSPARRGALRALLGVRLAGPRAWRSPGHPVEMAAASRAPLLVVHGEDDPYFPVADGEALAAAAGGPATLWRRPSGFGHAEDGLRDGFVHALAAAVAEQAATGRFPDVPEGE